MKRIIVKGTVLISPLVFTGFLIAAGQNGADPKAAPENKAKTLFEDTCGACHGTDLATSLRNTREQWAEIVQSMVDKGAYLKKEDTPVLLDYLAATYGVKKDTPAEKETPATTGGK